MGPRLALLTYISESCIEGNLNYALLIGILVHQFISKIFGKVLLFIIERGKENDLHMGTRLKVRVL